MKHVLDISVHQLVDFLLRTGDIDNRVFNRSSMNEGTLIHSIYQSKQGKNYLSEYYLEDTFVVDETILKLNGRADGIIKKSDSEFVIDEIKSTVIDLEEFRNSNLSWHLGQAKCYAYMFAKEQHLSTIGVKLTYIKQGNIKEKLYDEYLFTFEDLEKDIYFLVNEYLTFYNIIFRLQEERNESIAHLPFPYLTYRKGQRELAKYCYSIAKNGGRLFVEAPTGIGKTVSTLYPFIKALKDDEKSKIFYLTAKTSGKNSAYETMQALKKSGLKALDVLITAKDKICFCKDKACNPDECPYAKAYYNKIKTVIKEAIMSYSSFDRDTIEAIAKTFHVCPFELQLDLSLFCDVIICDYNYVFDPISYLKRFYDEDSSHYLVLVDEAHNLVDRGRKMYSARICRHSFEEARKSMRHIPNKTIKNQISKIRKIFDSFLELPDGQNEVGDFETSLYRTFDNFLSAYNEVNKNNNSDITKELTEFYLDVNRFMKINDYVGDNYLIYINKDEDITLNLLCLDASEYLGNKLKSVKGSVLFSATFSPIDYYIKVLGGDPENDPQLCLSSPFPKENLKLCIVPNISIKYKNREQSYESVAKYINVFVNQKIGNYFIYLPSYEYLNKLLPLLSLGENVDIHIQNKEMSEQEREEFLLNFEHSPNKTHIGFAIIGGAFSEGIDLVDDRLSGVLIVGIGLPKINYESNQISRWYQDNGLNGYDYAYLYPGMNKVMQAIGRLIRSESDKGTVLLIDERYLTMEYQNLYQKQYTQYEVVFSPEELSKRISHN